MNLSSEAHFPNPFPEGSDHSFKVTVFSTKKSDRGGFSVYCGKKLYVESSTLITAFALLRSSIFSALEPATSTSTAQKLAQALSSRAKGILQFLTLAHCNTADHHSLHSITCKGGVDFVVKNDKNAKWLAIDALKLEYH